MCGIAAIVSLRNHKISVLPDLLQILSQMQHRGRDSVGFGGIGLPGKPNWQWKKVGSAEDNFTPAKTLSISERFGGSRPITIGHVRYATASERDVDNAQPHHFGVGGQRFIISSNGDIPFCDEERKRLTETDKYQFESSCDAEVIVKLIGDAWLNNGRNEEDAFQKIGKTLSGAFSLVAITPSKRLFIMRDPIGFRPLWYAVDESTGLFYVCSESAILQKMVGAIPTEVLPGELIVVDPFAEGDEKIKKYRFANECQPRFCSMEIFYFSRPDSFPAGNDHRAMHTIRLDLGRQLGKEWLKMNRSIPNLVCPVPYSGNPAAQGFALELGLPYIGAIFKDRYAGRIFLGQADERTARTYNNLSIISDHVVGKKVAVVDDSVVRGDQSRDVAKKLYSAGAKEVYWLSSAPPYKFPCYFGINTTDPKKLIAHKRTVEEVRQIIGVDILHYLSLDGVFKITGPNGLCTACFTGNYPMPVPINGRAEV